ncbi:MAG: hypothetical protein HUU34_14240 [Saprospiraceae bacterium]|nr:hypothetical protein [Saprospiraceae bacterium]
MAGYSGEALFRGIFLFEGEVANKIPQIKNVKEAVVLRKISQKQKNAIAAISEYLVKEINNKQLRFFGQFKTAMESGNQLTITKSLADAQALIETVFKELDGEVKKFIESNNYKKLKQKYSASPKVKEISRKTPNPKELNKELLQVMEIVDKEARSSGSRADNVVVQSYCGLVLLCQTRIYGNFQAKIPKLKSYKYEDLRLSGSAAASDPDTDHNIAVLLLTFVAVVVIWLVALPLTSNFSDDSGLYREQMINSIATKLKVSTAGPNKIKKN